MDEDGLLKTYHTLQAKGGAAEGEAKDIDEALNKKLKEHVGVSSKNENSSNLILNL